MLNLYKLEFYNNQSLTSYSYHFHCKLSIGIQCFVQIDDRKQEYSF